MAQVVEAIYQNGVLTPLEALDLPENQRLIITLQIVTMEMPEQALQAWQQVYAGLADEEIAEVEQAAFDRKHFMAQED